MTMKAFLIAVVLISLVSSSTFAEDRLIGVSEHPQKDICSGDEVRAVVRPLFGSADGHKWVALNSAKATQKFSVKTISWLAIHDGKNMGSLTSEEVPFSAADHREYATNYMHHVVSHTGSIVLENTKNAFAGWCGTPIYRPVILVSGAGYEDPEGWTAYMPAPGVRRQILSAFKKTVGKKSLCSIEDDKLVPFPYKADNIKLMESLKSSHAQLIQATLDRDYTECDDERGMGTSPQWFLVKDGTVQWIGAGMELIDAGDYDADGKSELLFWSSNYNQDGYVIFYDNFKSKSEFIWSYH